MNLQNGTLDTRLPQNVIRNFEIPTNIEHDKLNPFKIGGGNAIWATHLPPNVSVWFSTNPNFDNAQKLDYMNRGMRFMSIGNDGIQQQYDNFYIFTEGTWDDSIKIAVSSQGDMVEPILSSNTGDIENVGRVAAISKMPINGASGYNEPDFEIKFENKYCVGLDMGSYAKNLYFSFFDFEMLNIIKQKKYLIEIDATIQNVTPLWKGGKSTATSAQYVFFGFPKKPLELFEITGLSYPNFKLYYSETYKDAATIMDDFTILGYVFPYSCVTQHSIFIPSTGYLQTKIIKKGEDLQNAPVICFAPQSSSLSGNPFGGFYNIHCRFYSL